MLVEQGFQSFHDDERQVLVRLTPEWLFYAPAGAPGWRCRLDAIAWTSSRIGSRGVDEVRLHAVDGHVAAAIPEFEGIERFYLALLEELSNRANLVEIREDLPTQVPRRERVLWLSTQTAHLGAWEALHVDEQGAVAVLPEGLVRAGHFGEHWDLTAWSALSGVRCRVRTPLFPETVLRFYASASHFDMPFAGSPEALRTTCRLYSHRLDQSAARPAPFRILGVTCADEELAMTYSWEIEQADVEGLLLPGEVVTACAFGSGEGSVVPDVEPSAAEGEPVRTELFLTDRRILQVDREPETGALLATSELPLAALKLMRRAEDALILGDLVLQTDMEQPFPIAGEFLGRYRRLVRSQLDPFESNPSETPLSNGVPPAPVELPDPFGPAVGAL